MSKAGQLTRLLNHIDDDFARREGSVMTGALVLEGAGIDPAHSADELEAVDWTPAQLLRGITISRVTAEASGSPAFETDHAVLSVNPQDNPARAFEIAIEPATRSMMFRGADGSSFNAWSRIMDDTNLGTLALLAANDLSDLADAETARGNLGLGGAATQDDERYLHAGSNLSDLEDASEARGHLSVYSGEEVDDIATALLSAITGRVPAGTIFSFGGGSAPTGFLLCDGAAVSREDYAGLFAVIGTTYGPGDETTTFNVPDLRGRAPIGSGTGAELTARSLGGKLGTETHTLTTDQIPAHRHLEGSYLRDGAGANDYEVPESGSRPGSYGGGQMARYYTDNTGGGEAHNNMQPSLVVNFIIKT